MKVANVYIEHSIMKLNYTFSYLLSGDGDLERGTRVKVAFNHQQIVGFVDSVFDIADLEQYQQEVGYQLKPIIEVIDKQPLLNDELYQLGLWLAKQTVSPVISCFNAMLPAALKPRTNNNHASLEKWVYIYEDEIVDTYQIERELSLNKFVEAVGQYRYNKYKKLGQIKVFEKEKSADYKQLTINEAKYQLTQQQKAAIEEINNCQENVILLHGLTGSGKTEIYMQLAKQTILNGRQVLILVPEISLTPMMVQRFKDRFSNIAIYHSGLSNQEKYQQYQLIKQNKVKIVIGTRSAIFTPLENIGLIVLDEEHDHSYKQDVQPAYNCKDIAIKRSLHHNCKVVLASATPTLESYARAIKGVYHLVTLNKRINGKLATSYLVDMNKQLRKGNYIISDVLQNAIADRLEKKQQVILLLNRRGYTVMMKCSNCGNVVKCPHCDVALSYHKDEEKLLCHCCGYSQSVDINCPNCHGKLFRNYGIGTQRLQEEVQKLFPTSRVIRMDADSTRNKDSHRKILDSFASGEYDILIGTQMIAKGLDFPNVTLVGVFNADGPLQRTDYRSVETTFDLIVQAAGRSGRNGYGEVYVQAYDIDHYGVQLAVKQDYIGFFNNEMKYRHIGKYPPYYYMVALVFSSKQDELCHQQAIAAGDYFKQDNTIRALGPSQLLKKKDEYRYRVILKGKDKDELINKAVAYYQQAEKNNKVNIFIDVDPYVLD